MTCTNATCAIFVVCQNKAKPCPGNAGFTRIVRNGYAANGETRICNENVCN